jgi:acyl carrier protein
VNATDNVLQEVREMVADVLALEVDEVQPGDSFVTKLAGDSLGFLELSFKCEKRYGIRLPFQKVIPEEALVADEQGVLTDESTSLLRRELPFLDYSLLGERPLKGRLLELLTVEAIAHLVRRAIGEKEASGSTELKMPSDPSLCARG